MKHLYRSIYFSFIFCLIIASCSTQKNRFLNRQYHGLNTKYNVVFNGNEALNIGEEILSATIEDNFFEIIKTDPILLKGESLDDKTIVPGFDKAEEKAVKAIQKHSMNIDGVQRNSNIDEAYLLLGKARYYDRRFFPAIEAFNFLLDNSTDESVYVEGRIWREKTNIRLQNNQTAINNLRPLARQLINKNHLYGQANATLAQAFINLKEVDSAIYYMTRASNHEKNQLRKVRYAYITAQLHETKGSKDLALYYYNSIVELNWQVPRKFWINAKINSLRLSHEKEGIPFVQPIHELLKVYENKTFSHSLNRALASHYSSKNKDSLVKIYLTKSLHSQGIDNPTRKVNYRDLADLNFKNKNYLLTGNYLDSLIPLLSKESIIKNKTQRELDNLSDVIFFENQFKYTDSLLTLLGLNKAEQIKFFEEFLKNKREAELKKIEFVSAKKKSNLFLNKKSTPSFYFYNPTLVLKGKQYYASTWGKRPNIDNWRNKIQAQFNNTSFQENKTKNEYKISKIEIESVNFYINQIPKSLGLKDSLKQKNHQAALKLGLIYKEKYKDKELSIKNLTYLINNEASPSFLSPALYHLYKIYLDESNELANEYKSILINKFPESIYSKVLQNPDNYVLGELRTPKSLYLKVLKKYLEGEYSEALSMMESIKVLLVTTKWEPKVMFLKAQILGRLNGKKVLIDQLETIIKEYPSSKIADKAKLDLDNINKSFKEQTKTLVQFKWVFPYKSESKFNPKELIDSLSININQLQNKNWRITNDIYNNDYQFIIIHGIKSKLEIDSIKKKLPQTTLKLLDSNNFVALSSKFRKIFIEKSWPTRN